jgi:hypothetical protein
MCSDLSKVARKPMSHTPLRLPVIAFFFLLMGIVVDLLPHPALGPGLIQSSMGIIFAEQEGAPTNLGQNHSVQVGQAAQHKTE